ncbi:MAG: hypothetical protein AAF500_17690 [Myxococcota bacterium]
MAIRISTRLMLTVALAFGWAGCSKSSEAERVQRPISSPKWPDPIARIPLPENWELDPSHAPGEPTITGPGGIRVTDVPAQMFVFAKDRSVRRAYRKAGQNVRRFRSVDDVVQKDFLPAAETERQRLVSQREVPELARYDERYHRLLYQAVPSKMAFHAVSTEWQDADGNPSLVLIRVFVSRAQGFQTWGYTAHLLEAPPDAFAKAREHLLYALLNTEHNRAFIADYNKREKEKAEASWRAHNQRMQARQRSFDAHQRAMRARQDSFDATQRAIRESNDAANDAIMNGWRDRNAMQDEGQEKFTDYLRDEQAVRDPSTGQRFKVESGSREYWKNGSDEHIGSDDLFYNPNTDPALHHQDWTKLEEER